MSSNIARKLVTMFRDQQKEELPLEILSNRENEVLQLLAKGLLYKEIADQLSIGEATVRTHVGNILSKLGANDRTHAVTIGLRRGIIDL